MLEALPKERDMTRILAINGSYRDGGITDQAVAIAARALLESGADVDTVLLRECDIEFCRNCRSCMQAPGADPGECVHNDGMRDLVRRIEDADGYILAAPTNLGSVTALFKRFMERLSVYAYWPWGRKAPEFRKAGKARKKALLVFSCAAPGLLGRMFFDTRKQLKMTAQTIGADPVGTLVVGLAAGGPEARFPRRLTAKAERLAGRLA
jgi:multimeric flavodoxin WrbA